MCVDESDELRMYIIYMYILNFTIATKEHNFNCQA